VYRSSEIAAEVPPGVLTVTSTVPAVSEGELAAQLVFVQLTAVAALEPKLTVVETEPETKPVPVTVTTVPPKSGPADGLMEVTVGITS
jgi:hypothetical protein